MYSEVNWSRADFLIDWGEKTIKLYVNNTFRVMVDFYYEDINEVNHLQIYNLKPNTTSYFQDVEVNENIPNLELSKGFNLSILLFFQIILCKFFLI